MIRDLNAFSILIQVIRKIWLQVFLLVLVLGGHFSLSLLPKEQNHPAYSKILSFVAVWIVVWCVIRIVSCVRDSETVTAKLAPNLKILVFIFLRLIVYAFGFLFALEALGISITPLLASLGIGSLAVGLALQDTLGNLFSGFYLHLDRPIMIGDWIRHESGVEGKVAAIGWRSTRLIAGGDNMVVIPNSKLSTAIVTNFSQPTQVTPFSILFGIPYEADLEQVERVILDATKKLAASKPEVYLLDEDSIQVRYQKFGESSIEAALSVKVKNFPDAGLARHELIKMVQSALSHEQIAVAYPIRVMHQTAQPQL